jgi:hypothetical protein
MMKHLIVFLAFLVMISTQAQANGADDIIKTVDQYCIGALKAGRDVATFSIEKKLAELPTHEAIKFSPEGGRVFTLPHKSVQAVLMNNKALPSVCSIAIHKISIETFQSALYAYFSKKNGYRLIKEKRIEGEKVTRTEFSGDIGGPIKILVTSSDSPRPNGIQVLISTGRADK